MKGKCQARVHSGGCIVTQFESLCNGIISMTSTWVVNASPRSKGARRRAPGRKVSPLEKMYRQWGALRDGFMAAFPFGPSKGIVPFSSADGISIHLRCPERTPDKGSGGHFHEPHPVTQYSIILELLGRQIPDHGVVFL